MALNQKNSGVNGLFFVKIAVLTAPNRTKAALLAFNGRTAALTAFNWENNSVTAFNC